MSLIFDSDFSSCVSNFLSFIMIPCLVKLNFELKVKWNHKSTITTIKCSFLPWAGQGGFRLFVILTSKVSRGFFESYSGADRLFYCFFFAVLWLKLCLFIVFGQSIVSCFSAILNSPFWRSVWLWGTLSWLCYEKQCSQGNHECCGNDYVFRFKKFSLEMHLQCKWCM